MRRSEKAIETREEIDAVIRGCLVCRLGMSDGRQPYVVPVSFGYDGMRLYFHTATEGKKIDMMLANQRVCFEFDRNVRLRRSLENACLWTFSYESVIGYGTVSELTSPEDKKHGLNQVMLQYSGKEWSFDPEFLAATRIWSIEIASVTGKCSKEKAN